MAKGFFYGGQAVIEGVLIRGMKGVAIALRAPEGDIKSFTQPVNPVFNGRLRRVPFVRGVIVLWETLEVGTKALVLSAEVAAGEGEGEMGKGGIGGALAIALVFAVGLFFVVPLALVRTLDPFIPSALLSNLVEGLVRLGVFLAYLVLIGLQADVRRVFAYHGAEHKTISAYEHGVPLEAREIQRYSTAHPRCGTAFLFTVVVVSILVFAFLGRPPLLLRILSRILLLPVVAAVSYEVIRFHGAHMGNRILRGIMAPSLALQAFTTRQPGDDQVEVAVCALKRAIALDEEEPSATFPTSGASEAPPRPPPG